VRVTLRYQKENPTETWVCAQAEARGVLNIKMGHKTTAGWPDRLFFIPGGCPLLIEFKKPGGIADTEPLQDHTHGLLRTLGYRVEVHDNRELALGSILKAVEAGRRAKKGRKVPD
jgi:hypothetical protein